MTKKRKFKTFMAFKAKTTDFSKNTTRLRVIWHSERIKGKVETGLVKYKEKIKKTLWSFDDEVSIEVKKISLLGQKLKQIIRNRRHLNK